MSDRYEVEGGTPFDCIIDRETDEKFPAHAERWVAEEMCRAMNLAHDRSGADELRKALEGLLETLEADGPETADEPDDASVGWRGDGSELPMTFGHIRRARAALKHSEAGE